MTTLSAPTVLPATLHGFHEVWRTLPSAALSFIVAAGCGILAVVYLPGQWLRYAAGPVAVWERPAMEEGDSRVRAKTRCTTCGVVVDIRPIEAAGGQGAAFEFTVRMNDGSVRISRDASASSWRHGDRIMLIGGVALPAATRN